jgi:hypothetical protein
MQNRITVAVTAVMALKHFDEIRARDASMAAGTTPEGLTSNRSLGRSTS